MICTYNASILQVAQRRYGNCSMLDSRLDGGVVRNWGKFKSKYSFKKKNIGFISK